MFSETSNARLTCVRFAFQADSASSRVQTIVLSGRVSEPEASPVNLGLSQASPLTPMSDTGPAASPFRNQFHSLPKHFCTDFVPQPQIRTTFLVRETFVPDTTRSQRAVRFNLLAVFHEPRCLGAGSGRHFRFGPVDLASCTLSVRFSIFSRRYSKARFTTASNCSRSKGMSK